MPLLIPNPLPFDPGAPRPPPAFLPWFHDRRETDLLVENFWTGGPCGYAGRTLFHHWHWHGLDPFWF